MQQYIQECIEYYGRTLSQTYRKHSNDDEDVKQLIFSVFDCIQKIRRINNIRYFQSQIGNIYPEDVSLVKQNITQVCALKLQASQYEWVESIQSCLAASASAVVQKAVCQ
eukprot:TRINITY_DN7380_c0_g1_i1.p5 TRINITY_DN7380_c0_g1~~TRINITY_DN7380_c0_g1_i1.p5  ORF type:complete len:110 (-),score=2.06 TRINITY_DN7380_c0_g1_i1:198-527(-)